MLQRAVAIAFLMLPTSAYASSFAVLMQPGGVSGEPNAFPSPPELHAKIAFWKDVFSVHSKRTVVLHDREYLDLVWLVLDLPLETSAQAKSAHSNTPAKLKAGPSIKRELSVSAQKMSAVVDRVKSKALIETRLKDLKKRLRRLEKTPEPKDAEDKRLLAIVVDLTRLRGAHLRLRTQRGIKENFDAGVLRARTLIPKIKKILKEEGVPERLAALPLVESAFNPRARSGAGAAGLWQLMPATAKQLGLKVTRKNDERFNIRKATRAAAKMLRQNFEMLERWPLAITGYNHGPYGVRRGVKLLGSTDLVYLIQNYKKSTWGFASKNFYAEFLAATHLLAEHFPDVLAQQTAALEANHTGTTVQTETASLQASATLTPSEEAANDITQHESPSL